MNNKKSIWLSNALIITLVAVLVAINILTAIAPSRYTRLDLSSNKIFTISTESKSFLKELDSEVEIFVINADGSMTPVEYTLERFEQHSRKLKVNYSIPDEELAAMGVESIDSVPAYTLIVKGKYRTTYILQNEMYYYTNDTYYDTFGNMTVSDYNSVLSTLAQILSQSTSANEYYQEMFYSLYAETKLNFDLESVLLERMEYVNTEYIPHPYYITGHGEPTQSILVSNLASFGYEELDLSSIDSIPENVASLIINSPQSDYSEKEAEMVSEYLANGGSLLIITSAKNAEMPNLMSIVEKYGTSTTSGLIAVNYAEEETTETETETEAEAETETEADTTDQTANSEEEDFNELAKYLLIPNINENHDSLYSLAGQNAYIFKANHIQIAESAPTVVVTKLLTVPNAYIENIESSESEKTLAVAIEDSTDNGIAKIVWFTGGESFADDMITEINFYLVAYSLSWSFKPFESQIGDIEAKLMTEEPFAPTELAYYGLPVLFAIIIPAAIIVIGLTVIKKRKSRKIIE